MLANEGKIWSLELVLTYGSSIGLDLITADFTEAATLTLGDLTLGGFTGYSTVYLGTMPSPSIVSGNAKSIRSSPAVFTNSSGGGVTIYGWCASYMGVILINATKLLSPYSLAASGSYNLDQSWYAGQLVIA